MQNIETHLFSYSYNGAQYQLEIPASSAEEAKERLSRMLFANYDGVLVAKVPALPPVSALIRPFVAIRNYFADVTGRLD